jgi:hypothetical protein
MGVDRIQAGQGACSQGAREAVELVSVPLVWLAQCATCGEVRQVFALEDSPNVECARCIRAGFDYAMRHCGPEIEENPRPWADAFAAIGEGMPARLAALIDRAADNARGNRLTCYQYVNDRDGRLVNVDAVHADALREDTLRGVNAPQGWTVGNTGGNCTALAFDLGRGFSWLLVSESDGMAPTRQGERCALYLEHVETGTLIERHDIGAAAAFRECARWQVSQ